MSQHRRPIARPAESEYDPFYAGYVAAVPPEADVLELLREQGEKLQRTVAGLIEERGTHRYAPGKWSIKEVLGHLIDSERVFAFRALAFARRDPQPIPGMDQDTWVPAAAFDRRTLADLAAEHAGVRAGDLALFASFDDAALACSGVASGAEVTVRALLFIIAGHERHHLGVLRERYL